jgi:hypothetical protein
MKFCEYCENMLYITLTPEKDLLYYCKNCDNKVVEKKELGSICVIDDNKVDDVTKYSQYMNKYIKHDPTLPRVNNIVCTNQQCTKKKDADNEVIYIKYDFVKMRYLYFCCHCETFFKPE